MTASKMSNQVSISNEPAEVFYYQQVFDDQDNLLFKTPWAGVLIHNCSDSGELLKFRNLKQFENFQKETGEQKWIYIKLKLLRNPSDSRTYGVYVCPNCPSMAGVMALATTQVEEEVRQSLCKHSRVLESIVGDYRDHWNVDLDPNDEISNLNHNAEVPAASFLSLEENSQCLSAVRSSHGEIIYLYTATKNSKVPICCKCARQRHCQHAKDFGSFLSQNEVDNSSDDENESYENLEEPAHTENTENVTVADDDEEEGPNNPDEDEVETGPKYYEKLPRDKFAKLYGYNYKDFKFPIAEADLDFREKWNQRMQGKFNLPEALIPPYNSEETCFKCENRFEMDDSKLLRVASNIKVFTLSGERIFSVPVFARPTLDRACRCMHHFDGSDDLIWNLGRGRFIDYRVLYSHLHNWKLSGVKMYALFKSLRLQAISCGLTTDLSYRDIHRAFTGFVSLCDSDWEKRFTCPIEGRSVKWIIADGKCTGPRRSKVENVNELFASEESEVLADSTKHSQRVFLAEQKERKMVLDLVNEEITVRDFLNSDDVATNNGGLVRDVLIELQRSDPNIENLPEPYNKFLTEVSKPYSARALLQVNRPIPLHFLQQYCEDNLNIRDYNSQNPNTVKSLKSSFPALWPVLENIIQTENRRNLPRSVATIVLRLIEIRKETFATAATRSDENYTAASENETATQCYPANKLIRLPSNYEHYQVCVFYY